MKIININCHFSIQLYCFLGGPYGSDHCLVLLGVSRSTVNCISFVTFVSEFEPVECRSNK